MSEEWRQEGDMLVVEHEHGQITVGLWHGEVAARSWTWDGYCADGHPAIYLATPGQCPLCGGEDLSVDVGVRCANTAAAARRTCVVSDPHSHHRRPRSVPVAAPLVQPGLTWQCPQCGWPYTSPVPVLSVSHRCGGQTRRLRPC